MIDCVFCKIIAGEIPAHKIYENDEVLAFLDIHPVNPGHVLIVPKAHFENMLDAPAHVLSAMSEVSQKIAKAVMKTVGAEGFNLNVNNGKMAGQVIFHLHMHIVPRFSGDGLRLWTGREYKEGEAEMLVKNIKSALSELAN